MACRWWNWGEGTRFAFGSGSLLRIRALDFRRYSRPNIRACLVALPMKMVSRAQRPLLGSDTAEARESNLGMHRDRFVKTYVHNPLTTTRHSMVAYYCPSVNEAGIS